MRHARVLQCHMILEFPARFHQAALQLAYAICCPPLMAMLAPLTKAASSEQR